MFYELSNTLVRRLFFQPFGASVTERTEIATAFVGAYNLIAVDESFTVFGGTAVDDLVVVNNRSSAVQILPGAFRGLSDFHVERRGILDSGTLYVSKRVSPQVGLEPYAIELTSGWTNEDSPPDVNGDGNVSPLDALLVINELSEMQYSDSAGTLVTPRPDEANQFDVNGDGFVAPLDALLVINELSSDSSETTPASLVFSINPADDDDEEAERRIDVWAAESINQRLPDSVD